MLGVFTNMAAVLAGGTIGLLLKKGIPERFVTILHQALGLSVLSVGILGVIKGESQLVLILSVVLGALIGECLRLDDRLNRFAEQLGKNVRAQGDHGPFIQGFTTGTIVFCIGSMSIVGSLQSGLGGGHEMIFAKSALDFVSAMVFASSMGLGVLFSSVSVLLIQGGIVLSAQFLSPLFDQTMINEMTAAGSVIIIAIGMNLALKKEIKVTNLIPAAFLPIILSRLLALVA